MSLTVPSTHDDTLDITIRFSASLPDLPLSISLTSSPHANTSTLKQLIRPNLPTEYTTKRIRLIYAGKALLEDAPLSTTLKRPSRPPSRISTPVPDSRGKGKEPLRDIPQQARIYIHCSIGDLALSSSELAAEAALAYPQEQPAPSASEPTQSATIQDASTAPGPRGFDRLSTAGFSPAEISSLRMQFLSIQSHTHTPDTMPSPTALRAMEDAWLDSSDPTSLSLSDPSDPSSGTGRAGYEEAEAGALDDMIYGTCMGFFWPIGCLMWGVREEGVWSGRRKMAVVVGVLLNLGLGLVRYSG